MKKLFAIILTICMLASVLCVPVFAEDESLPEPAEGIVLRVTAINGDDTKLIGDYDNFEDGWNAAMEIAGDTKQMKNNNYDRIVVDLYADWNAVDGEFTDGRNGDGFDNDTIYVPEDARVTLNLNEHTINRGLTDDQNDGEVIFINDDADVIINNGTITGGYSNSEGAGLYVEGGVSLTLNDVHIIGNRVHNDDGAGIYMYGGSSLIMNGGSFENNTISGRVSSCYGGAVYLNDSSAAFNGVEFKNNVTMDFYHQGLAIYADDSVVLINECKFEANGVANEEKEIYAALSVVHGIDSSITIKKSTFTNNGSLNYYKKNGLSGKYSLDYVSTLITVKGTTLTIDDDCRFLNNAPVYLIRSINNNAFYISNSTFKDNRSVVFYSGHHTEDSYFKNCSFNNNSVRDTLFLYTIDVDGEILTFYDCSLGNSIIDRKDTDCIKYASSSVLESEALIRVSALLADGTIDFTECYKNFEAGWDLAMNTAKTNYYDRVVVDLYADWTTRNSHTTDYVINIPENVKVTINMNGHTIDANRLVSIINGEVIYVGVGADVIINDGTIKGGYSRNGAGGIHIKDNATVVLNNVDVVENYTMAGANGSGIAVYDGATLTMNGGSISRSEASGVLSCGTLYVEEATAILNGVIINDNYTLNTGVEGIAIYAVDSTVTLNNCVVSNNADDADRDEYVVSIISAYDSKLIIKNTDFTGNGVVSPSIDTDYSHLLYLEDSSLIMEGGKITGNAADKLFYFEDSKADIKGVTITGNASVVFDIENSSEKVTLTECVLGNNSPVKYNEDILVETKGTLVLNDCDLGDTTYADKSMVTFSNENVGSIFGEGSLTMIVAFIALVTSVAAIILNVSSKKKAVPAGANNIEENKK